MKTMMAVLAVLVVGAAPEPKREGKTREEWKGWLKEQRKTQLERLNKYQKDGKFPMAGDGVAPVGKKDPHFDAGQERYHQFVDAKGNLCALAHLVAGSGNRKIVDAIAKRDNGFCVGAGKDEALAAWILRSGLTLEDCVSIQEPGFELELVDPVAELKKRITDIAAELQKKTDERLETATERLWASLEP